MPRSAITQARLPRDTTVEEVRDLLTQEHEYVAWLIRRVRELTEAVAGIRVYGVAEAAELLQTSRDQVYAYIRTGQLKAFTLVDGGHKLLIQDTDLQALIDARKEATP